MKHFLLPLVLATALLCSAQEKYGEVHFANSGSPAAQAAFLLGLAQLHDFEYPSAIKNFRQAESIDPGFAMAYWGEAMSYNHAVWHEEDVAAARAALQKLGATPADRLAKAPTEREKDYLRTLDVLYGEGTKQQRDDRWAEAMAELHRKYPDDVDATAFYALALLGSCNSGRDFATYMRSAALLEEVFPANSNHPGVLHYLIHSYDDPIHAPLGMRAARRYGEVAADAPHALHMTSHIFIAMGMWNDVTDANQRSMAVADRHRAEHNLGPSRCGHVPSWLEYSLLQQGRFQEAKTLLDECRAQAEKSASAANSDPDPDSSLVASYIDMRTRYIIDDGNRKETPFNVASMGDVQVAAQYPIPARASSWAKLQYAYGSGIAAYKNGDAKALRVAAAEFKNFAATRSGADHMASMDPNYEKSIEVEQAQLEALLLFLQGKQQEAAQALQKTAAEENAMAFEFGPPMIDKPTYELLGEVLLSLKQPAEASTALKNALSRTPGRTNTLRLLAEAQTSTGDTVAAARTKAKLEMNLSHAQTGENRSASTGNKR